MTRFSRPPLLAEERYFACLLWGRWFLSWSMIQRDYLMRMIQEFIKVMMMVLEAKKAGDWGAVEENLDWAAKTYLGLERVAVCRLGAGALKRRLIGTGPTQEYKVRAQVMCRILVESAAAAAGRGAGEQERSLLLQALHLLLDTGRWICFDEGNSFPHISSAYVQTARRRIFVGNGFSPLPACSRLLSRCCGNNGGNRALCGNGRQAYVLE